uniref:Uncharacterized protein n=1 Tax=Cacopsylla melanoneura TaxID=428564 RepID=A0A8D9BQ25_9HEMI
MRRKVVEEGRGNGFYCGRRDLNTKVGEEKRSKSRVNYPHDPLYKFFPLRSGGIFAPLEKKGRKIPPHTQGEIFAIKLRWVNKEIVLFFPPLILLYTKRFHVTNFFR